MSIDRNELQLMAEAEGLAKKPQYEVLESRIFTPEELEKIQTSEFKDLLKLKEVQSLDIQGGKIKPVDHFIGLYDYKEKKAIGIGECGGFIALTGFLKSGKSYVSGHIVRMLTQGIECGSDNPIGLMQGKKVDGLTLLFNTEMTPQDIQTRKAIYGDRVIPYCLNDVGDDIILFIKAKIHELSMQGESVQCIVIDGMKNVLKGRGNDPEFSSRLAEGLRILCQSLGILAFTITHKAKNARYDPEAMATGSYGAEEGANAMAVINLTIDPKTGLRKLSIPASRYGGELEYEYIIENENSIIIQEWPEKSKGGHEKETTKNPTAHNVATFIEFMETEAKLGSHLKEYCAKEIFPTKDSVKRWYGGLLEYCSDKKYIKPTGEAKGRDKEWKATKAGRDFALNQRMKF